MRWVAYIDPSGWADCSAGSHLSRRTAPPDLAPFPAGSRGGCRGFTGPVPSASLDALPGDPPTSHRTFFLHMVVKGARERQSPTGLPGYGGYSGRRERAGRDRDRRRPGGAALIRVIQDAERVAAGDTKVGSCSAAAYVEQFQPSPALRDFLLGWWQLMGGAPPERGAVADALGSIATHGGLAGLVTCLAHG